MSWPPKTWVNDVLATAAEFNEFVRDPLNDLDQHKHTGAVGDGDDALGPMATANFVDQAASPAVDGRMQRNGAGLEYYDGATVIALGKADQAAAVASPRTLGTGASQAAAGNHAHTLSQGTTNAFNQLSPADDQTPTTKAKRVSTVEVNLTGNTLITGPTANQRLVVVGAICGKDDGTIRTVTLRLYRDGVEVASTAQATIASEPQTIVVVYSTQTTGTVSWSLRVIIDAGNFDVFGADGVANGGPTITSFTIGF